MEPRRAFAAAQSWASKPTVVPLVRVVFLLFFRFAMFNSFSLVSRVPKHAPYSRTRRSDETFYLNEIADQRPMERISHTQADLKKRPSRGISRHILANC